MKLDDKVEFYARKMCEILEVPSEGWIEFQRDIREWFILEAFRRVRDEFWNEEKIKDVMKV